MIKISQNVPYREIGNPPVAGLSSEKHTSKLVKRWEHLQYNFVRQQPAKVNLYTCMWCSGSLGGVVKFGELQSCSGSVLVSGGGRGGEGGSMYTCMYMYGFNQLISLLCNIPLLKRATSSHT